VGNSPAVACAAGPRETTHHVGSACDSRDKTRNPTRFGKAVIVGEAQDLRTRCACTGVSRRSDPLPALPHEPRSAAGRNGRNRIEILGSVVDDDDFEARKRLLLGSERGQAPSQACSPVERRDDHGGRWECRSWHVAHPKDGHRSLGLGTTLCSAVTIDRDAPVRTADRSATFSRTRRRFLELPSGARAVEVLLALTASDLRARYGRGPWQFFKWLVDPFALVGIYLLLVTFILRRPGEAPGLSLACAVIPFQLVMMTIVNAMTAVNLRGSIIRNMAFDRVLIPVSSALTEAVAFGASLVLFVVMMLAYGVKPTTSIFWLPLAIAVTAFFSVACAYLASLIGLWFRDLRPFMVSFVRAMFFLAPGLVAINQIGGLAETFVKVNPLTGLFELFRSAVLEGRAPHVWEFASPLAWGIGILTAAFPLYVLEQRQFAKVIE
jgi:ABC-2 type transport system permease protein